LKIFREITPIFTYDFNNGYVSKFYYNFSFPRDNANFSKDSKVFGLNCIDDKNYFFINTIRFTLESGNKEMHEKFWIKIEENFSKLLP
jgi:hypothetical protein